MKTETIYVPVDTPSKLKVGAFNLIGDKHYAYVEKKENMVIMTVEEFKEKILTTCREFANCNGLDEDDFEVHFTNLLNK